MTIQIGTLLGPGEHLVWSGAPATLLFLSRRQAVSLAILGVYALVIALVTLTFLAGGGGAAGVIALLLIIPFLLDFWRLKNWLILRNGERYVLTDRRALVVDRDGALRSSTGLLKASAFRLVGAPSTRKTIIMGIDEPLWTPKSGRNLKLKASEDAPRFSGLDEGPAVFALMLKTAEDYEMRWATSANGPDD